MYYYKTGYNLLDNLKERECKLWKNGIAAGYFLILYPNMHWSMNLMIDSLVVGWSFERFYVFDDFHRGAFIIILDSRLPL